MTSQSELATTGEIEFVSFSVAQQKFCLEITQIREIRRWSPVTVLPHAPSDVLGVMNLRGAVIPIYDLAGRFQLGKTQEGARNVVIVTSIHDKQVGLLVESVSEIISVPADSIQETPDVKSEATKDCIHGVISIEEQMIRIINLESVIHAPEKSLV
jgi:purine-binding chemotaxis protein CheW